MITTDTIDKCFIISENCMYSKKQLHFHSNRKKLDLFIKLNRQLHM